VPAGSGYRRRVGPIENLQAKVNTALAGYSRTFALAGQTASAAWSCSIGGSTAEPAAREAYFRIGEAMLATSPCCFTGPGAKMSGFFKGALHER
jgi:hypothetical protein